MAWSSATTGSSPLPAADGDAALPDILCGGARWAADVLVALFTKTGVRMLPGAIRGVYERTAEERKCTLGTVGPNNYKYLTSRFGRVIPRSAQTTCETTFLRPLGRSDAELIRFLRGKRKSGGTLSV